MIVIVAAVAVAVVLYRAIIFSAAVGCFCDFSFAVFSCMFI